MEFDDRWCAIAKGLDGSAQIKRIADALDVLAGRERLNAVRQWLDHEAEIEKYQHLDNAAAQERVRRARREMTALERLHPWLKES